MVVLGAAIPILIGLAVYVLVADDGETATTTDDTTAPTPSDGSPGATTAAPAPTAPPATAPPATAPPATSPPATAPPTTAPTTEPTPTTLPPEPTREPVSVSPGDPNECEYTVGTGGPLADIGERATGFDIAIARELIDRVWDSRAVCYLDIATADRFPALAERRVQLVVRSVIATTSRDEVADFSQPYLVNGLAVAAEVSTGLTPDLSGLTVGALGSGSDPDLLFDNTDFRRLREYGSVDALVTALRNREVDAIAANWTALQQEYGDNANIEILFLGLRPEPIVVAVREGAEARRGALDEALAAMIADGTWAEIFTAEFGIEPFVDPATLATYEPIDR